MANAAPKQPSPLTYQTQRAIVLRAADEDVIRLLRELQADVRRMLNEVARRPGGIGRDIREAQLRLVQRNLHAELGKVWRKLGKVTEARRAEAAARAAQYTADVNAFRLVTGGLADGATIAEAIYDAEVEAARSGLDRLIARQSGASYVSLSERVYNSNVNIGSKVDKLVNSALARGLSAVEFAKEVRAFVNPLTPGGVSYAAMRLARTEINNAAHAMSVEAVRETPWVDVMEWRLSGSHGRPDVCDRYAKGGPNSDGRYLKRAVPVKPHPQCLCYVIPVAVDDDEFERNLLAGHYNNYLERYRNIQPGQVVKTSYGGFTGPPPAPKVVKPTQVGKPGKAGAKPPTQAKPPTAAKPPARVSAPAQGFPENAKAAAELRAKRLMTEGNSFARTRNTLAKEFNVTKEEAEAFLRTLTPGVPTTTAAKQATATAPRPVVKPVAPKPVSPAPLPTSPVRGPVPESITTTNILPEANIPEVFRQKLAEINFMPRGSDAFRAVQSELEHQAELVPEVARQLDGVFFNKSSELRGSIVNGYYAQPYNPVSRRLQREIHMSARTFEPGYEAEQLHSEVTGFKTSCGHGHTGAQSVLAHEFGHHVDYVVREFAIRGELGQLWGQVAKSLGVPAPSNSGDIAIQSWMKKHSDVIKRKISGYASTNRTEFLAEIWREYSGNPNARREVREIGALLHKMARDLVR